MPHSVVTEEQIDRSELQDVWVLASGMERLRGGHHWHRPLHTPLRLHLHLDHRRLFRVRCHLPHHGLHFVPNGNNVSLILTTHRLTNVSPLSKSTCLILLPMQALRKYKTQVGANEPMDRAKWQKMIKQASKVTYKRE